MRKKRQTLKRVRVTEMRWNIEGNYSTDEQREALTYLLEVLDRIVKSVRRDLGRDADLMVKTTFSHSRLEWDFFLRVSHFGKHHAYVVALGMGLKPFPYIARRIFEGDTQTGSAVLRNWRALAF